ncbi:MAG: DinB family protein [Planctomycetota bacterium]
MRQFAQPLAGEYHDFYQKYIDQVAPDQFTEQLESQPQTLRDLLQGLPADELEKLHEPYTWSLKQVVGHLIDGERIFSDRMVRIAVGDETPIPGIDQQMFVRGVDFGGLELESLLDEFELLRKANILAAHRYSESALANLGVASDASVSARANLYILVGHVAYHLQIIGKRVGR